MKFSIDLAISAKPGPCGSHNTVTRKDYVALVYTGLYVIQFPFLQKKDILTIYVFILIGSILIHQISLDT